MGIFSKINRHEAISIKERALTKYNNIVSQIKIAAQKGYPSVCVDEIDNYEIRERLKNDGFELSTIKGKNLGDEYKKEIKHFDKNKKYDYIWWG